MATICAVLPLTAQLSQTSHLSDSSRKHVRRCLSCTSRQHLSKRNLHFLGSQRYVVDRSPLTRASDGDGEQLTKDTEKDSSPGPGKYLQPLWYSRSLCTFLAISFIHYTLDEHSYILHHTSYIIHTFLHKICTLYWTEYFLRYSGSKNRTRCARTTDRQRHCFSRNKDQVYQV